jgi:DNA-binding winged helix-turn-helix (wHTH) protein
MHRDLSERGPARTSMPALIRFGTFQLDTEAGQLLKKGRVIRLKPQPLRLLQLLLSRPGELVTRDEIRALLWGADTFVDFEQGMNTAVRQIREALGDDAERPIFVETVPKRGYRFIAPVDAGVPATTPSPVHPRGTDLNLHKAMWLNIAELRLAEVKRRKRRRQLYVAAIVAGVILVTAAALFLIAKMR